MNEWVSDGALREIGRVVVWSAEVDVILGSILDDLVGSRRAKLLSAGQNFVWLKDAIRQVVKGAWDGGDETLFALLDEAARLHVQRDLVVHGLWLPTDIDAYLNDEDPTEYHTVRPRRWSENLRGEVISDERLRALADELSSVSVRLRKWQDDYLPYLDEHQSHTGWERPRPTS